MIINQFQLNLTVDSDQRNQNLKKYEQSEFYIFTKWPITRCRGSILTKNQGPRGSICNQNQQKIFCSTRHEIPTSSSFFSNKIFNLISVLQLRKTPFSNRAWVLASGTLVFLDFFTLAVKVLIWGLQKRLTADFILPVNLKNHEMNKYSSKK